MTLTDAGPLIALIDADEADHRLCVEYATLVALAELRNERRIFTLDRDFDIYRLHGRRRFEVVPR